MRKFQFILYVAGNSPNSVLASKNLRAFCEQRLPKNTYAIEIVDVLANPQRAVDENILAVPTLIRLRPAPVQRVIGNLADIRSLSALLDADTT